MPPPFPGPDIAAMERIARAAFERLPAPFTEHLDGVALRVEEFANAEALASVDLDNPWDLTGLYQGRPLSEQSIWTSGELPPVITLFRSPLLAERQATGVGLEELIAHVVIHEVGHHFGLSDDDMHAIEHGGG